MNAAIPTVSDRNISTGVFRDTYAMLTCPIPLPTVRSLYTIMWEQIVDSTATQIMNDSESSRYILSFDNRLLSVLVSNSTDRRIFRCRINLQRCSDTHLCQSFDVLGPLMNTHVLGKFMKLYNINGEMKGACSENTLQFFYSHACVNTC